MLYTEYLKLKKPGLTDTADIQDINDNMDIIDSKVKTHLAEMATQDKAGHIKLSDIPLPAIATQSEAETGTNNTKMMTPLRVANAIDSKVRVIDNRVEININDQWLTFIYLPDDESGSPGNTKLIAGDWNAGFFGEVPASQLITGDALASAVGISEGKSQFSSGVWLKFAIDGKIIFSPMKTIRYEISFNAINTANCVDGSKTITINGNVYKVRLWKGSKNNPANLSNGDAIGSEWNRLMLPIHINAPNNWSYPEHGGITEDWGINFTNDALMVKLNSSLGWGSYTWCQENIDGDTTRVVVRGYNGVSYAGTYGKQYRTSHHGWRPVLELVQ